MIAHYPTTIDEALAALDDGAVPLAGGTDMMVEVNFGDRKADHIVGLRRIEKLADWDANRIGAGVTWSRIEHEGPRALAQAARTVGSPQIRNAGTIGGNVATASPAGDGLPFLLAIDASVELTSTGGTREILAGEFFTGVKKTQRQTNELITALVFPEGLPARQEFGKVGVRSAMVIATVCCVVTRSESGDTRVALGSVAPTPIRARQAEEMISSISSPTEEDLVEFGRIVSSEISPITDHRSTESYRRHAAGVLARRLLARCLR